MVYFMLFSIKRMNLSASDLLIANNTEAARIKSKNRHTEKPKQSHCVHTRLNSADSVPTSFDGFHHPRFAE